MKKVGISSILVLLTLCLVAVPMVRAAQPVIKEVTTEVLDGPYGDFYAKGVLHGVLIGRVLEAGVVKVKITHIEKFNIYELVGDEAGEFLGTANMNLEYSGIVHDNGEMEMWTGTYSGTWVINADVELPEGATYKGHITRIYREGVIFKEIIHGVPPFPLP